MLYVISFLRKDLRLVLLKGNFGGGLDFEWTVEKRIRKVVKIVTAGVESRVDMNRNLGLACVRPERSIT